MSGDHSSSKSTEKLIHHLRVENQTLLDQISILRLQCKSFEDESRKSVEKLTCLKLLVKRAWCGDQEASTHVANIVGVAAPLFKIDGNEEIVIIPQRRGLNNWAYLAARLLERFYKQRDDILFLKKREFLLERESYLDTQLDGYVNDSRVNQQSLELVLALNKNQVDKDNNFEQLPSQRSGFSFRRLNKKRSSAKTTSTIQSENSYENLNSLAIEPISFKEEDKTSAKVQRSRRTERPCSANPKSISKTPRPRSSIPNSNFRASRPSSANPKSSSKDSQLSSANPRSKTRPESANLKSTSTSPKHSIDKFNKTQQPHRKESNTVTILRHKSARAVQKQSKPKIDKRPFSAHVKYMDISSSKSHDSYTSMDAARQLNAVEKELRKTRHCYKRNCLLIH